MWSNSGYQYRKIAYQYWWNRGWKHKDSDDLKIAFFCYFSQAYLGVNQDALMSEPEFDDHSDSSQATALAAWGNVK